MLQFMYLSISYTNVRQLISREGGLNLPLCLSKNQSARLCVLTFLPNSMSCSICIADNTHIDVAVLIAIAGA